MYGRHTIVFPLAVLLLMAAITLWIERTVKAPQHHPASAVRHDPDYIVSNFMTTKTDIQGNIQYVLNAAEMKHFPDDDTTHLVQPHLEQYTAGKPSTQIESQEGLVSSDGENVQFIGNVRVVRQASADRGELVVRTQFLNVNPNTEIATTDRPVVITEAPKTEVHAIGMIYDKKKRTVHLLSKVRAHYEKPVSSRAGNKATAGAKTPTRRRK